MSQKTLRIIRENRDTLRIEHIKNGYFDPIGHSYSLERFLSKIKRKGADIRRTGYGGLAYVTGNEFLVSCWDKANIQIGQKIETDA